MGWIPEPGAIDHGALTGLGDDDHPQYLTEAEHDALDHELIAAAVRTLEVVAEAAPKTTQSNAPHAVFDPVSNKTYLAYEGLERDLYVTYFDHFTGEMATPVEIDNNPLFDNNTHGVPTLVIDHAGHLHIVWGAHNSNHRHLKSDNPWDISAWTAQSIAGAGTYPYLLVDPATGDIYLFDRAGTGHSATFPSHEFGAIRKLPAGSTTWTAAARIVDTTGSPEAASDFYQRAAVVGDDGLFHIMWTVARGSGHDVDRRNIYHAKYDPSDSKFYAADDTDLGTIVDWTEHTACLAATRSNLVGGFMAVDGERIVILYQGPETGNRFHYATVWDGSSWTGDTQTGIDNWDTGGYAFPYFVNGSIRALLAADNGGSFADIDLYGALDDGSDWFKHSTILEGASGEGFNRVVPVGGGGPVVGMAMEAPTGNADTNATLSDLLPVYFIFDTAAVSSGGSAAHDHDDEYSPLGHTHDDRYYTEAEVDALVAGSGGGAGELLMQDGVTAPPVPLENEARDDWLYEG